MGNRSVYEKVSFLASFGIVDFTIISLYQLGVIKRLPDVPGKVFDSNYVNASKEAHIMGVPDGPISLCIYLLILTMLMFRRKNKENKTLNLLLGGLITVNAIGAAEYLRVMLFKQKRICLYCVAGAVINFWMLLLTPKLFRKGIN